MNQALALLAEFKRLLEERDKHIVRLEAEKAALAAEVRALKAALDEQQARLMETAAMK